MNTNTIKSFARQARILLLEGVRQRLSYWGFQANGTNDLTLETTSGGYIFRGQVFTDTSVPATWNKLKKRLTSKQAVQDAIEEAAYVWFNRLMAIKMLEENAYLSPQLRYTPGVRTPLLVQNAKKGQHGIIRRPYLDLLNEYLREDKEEEAFGLLLTRFCNNHALLHDVFGRIDDYTELLLPQNLLQSGGLMDLINGEAIPADDYREVELIGWLYQFYISDKKDDVFAGFKKGKKARAEDIPAATQIFTPKWIVKYMVENTVGKLYLDYEPASGLKAGMKYLVVNESDANGQSLITDLEELTLLDPAAGSGHILVTGFELLFNMYREAGYTARNAVESILKHNLFGLDIDDRAMQLARFAVLLKAASYDATILDKGILPHIYSFPVLADFSEADIQTFLGTQGQPYQPELAEALTLLSQGKNIGSALKIELSLEARSLVARQYEQWQQKQRTASLSIQETSLWNNLCPYLEVLLVLSRQYAAVVANPPYMGQKSMNGPLKDYVNTQYPRSKSDLMTVFMEVIPNLTLNHSRFALINLPSWLFLSSFEKLRDDYLEYYQFDSLLHMGRGIFGIDFGSVAFAMKKEKTENPIGSYFRLHERNFQHIHYTDIEKLFLYSNGNDTYKYDFSLYRDEDGITEIPEHGSTEGQKLFYPNISQTNFFKIPGSPIAYWVSEEEKDSYLSGNYFASVCNPKKGIDTGENKTFLRFWYEVSISKCSLASFDEGRKWYPYNKGGEFRKWYGNRENLINWENLGSEIKSRLSWSSKKPTIRNTQYHFKEGFSWSTISSTGFSCRYVPPGCMFDNGGCTLFAERDLLYLGAMLNSKVASRYLEFLSPTLNFQPGDIGRVLYYDPGKWRDQITSRANVQIVLSKTDWDCQETSWDFAQSALFNEAPSLKQAYQRWEAVATRDFFQLHANEEELNRIFIDIYGLQEELTPEVLLKDITVLQEELDRSALEGLVRKEDELPQLPIKKDEVLSQFVSYAIGVLLGRYRLDVPGLHIAHPNPTEQETAGYTYQGHAITIDEDAILPLMGDDGAFPDDALLRTKDLILAIWGEGTLTENLNFLHDSLGMNLHKWLTEKFWGYHTGMYKKKPIYWLFCSNPKKPHQAAFRVLVYMHRMDKYTVGKIQRQYLHPHQEYIRHEIQRLAEQENDLGKSELKRLETLRRHELECRDYNEVLKALSLREIEFDLDDGVDVNYAKFEGAVAKI